MAIHHGAMRILLPLCAILAISSDAAAVGGEAYAGVRNGLLVDAAAVRLDDLAGTWVFDLAVMRDLAEARLRDQGVADPAAPLAELQTRLKDAELVFVGSQFHLDLQGSRRSAEYLLLNDTKGSPSRLALTYGDGHQERATVALKDRRLLLEPERRRECWVLVRKPPPAVVPPITTTTDPGSTEVKVPVGGTPPPPQPPPPPPNVAPTPAAPPVDGPVPPAP